MERVLGVGLGIRLPEPCRSLGDLQRRQRTQRRHSARKRHGGAQGLSVLAVAGSGNLT